MTKIKAVPTFYKGIQFRSRLESTWAAFFDLMQWDWRYEPFDLIGWTPDFEIQTSKGNRRLLVEVKPESLQNYNIDNIELTPYKKVIKHVDDFNILLLGTGLFSKDDYTCLGILLETKLKYTDKYRICIDNKNPKYNADIAAIKEQDEIYGISPLYGFWCDLIKDKICHKAFIDYKTHTDVKSLFNEAINNTKHFYHN